MNQNSGCWMEGAVYAGEKNIAPNLVKLARTEGNLKCGLFLRKQ